MALLVEYGSNRSSAEVAALSWPVLGASEKSRFLLEMKSRWRQYSAGATIAHEGQSIACVICVLDGWVGLSKGLENGQSQIIDFALPGDIILPVTADGLTSLFDIVAQNPAQLAVVSISEWEKLEREIKGLSSLVRLLEAAAHARLAERYLRMGKGDAQMRIAFALLEFFVRLSSHSAAFTDCFHVPLKQQQLGDFTGVSSVHVCRTLKGFERQGVLSVKRHMDITITDPVALSEIAEVSFESLRLSIAPCSRN